MKFTCNRSQLADAIALAIRAVPSHPTHPVLANVCLYADADLQRINLIGFDLSLGIRTRFGATVDEGGEVAIPAKLLNDIVSKLPDGPISLEDETGLVTLTCLTGNYELRSMSPDEFPSLPEIEDGQTLEISAGGLREALGGVLFAASGDETKQILTGVHVSATPLGLELAATDGHRLAVVSDPSDEFSESVNVTIPASSLTEMFRAIAKLSDETSVSLSFDDETAVLETEDQRVTSRVLDGAYPAYNQLIPQQFATHMTVDRRQLLSTLERISVIADRKNNIVKFTISEASSTLTLSVDAADVGSGKESISIQLNGNDLLIAFNVRYVIGSLRSLASNEVQFAFNTPTSPVVMTPLGGIQAKHLVMPVQIRD